MVAEERIGVVRKLAGRHRKRLKALEGEQTKLLQLFYDGGVARPVM